MSMLQEAQESMRVVGWATAPWRWRAVVAVLLAGLLLCGGATVARFHVWAQVDERHHYAYVQELAEHGRLPRIADALPWEAWAINTAHPTRSGLAQAGAIGQSYEAWQPPLYYLAATPVFLTVGDHRHKVFALRAFDLALVLVAAALLWRLARRALPEAPLAAFAGGLGVLLWPGVLVRSVTVSNTPLELVLTTGALLGLERAWTRRDGRQLALAGVVVGAALLTKVALTFLLPGLILVAFALRRSRAGLDGHRARRSGRAAGAVADHERRSLWLANRQCSVPAPARTGHVPQRHPAQAERALRSARGPARRRVAVGIGRPSWRSRGCGPRHCCSSSRSSRAAWPP